MKIFRICVFFLAVVILSGCASVHNFKVARGIKEADTINIITDAETRKGFLDVMTEWLSENGYKYNVLPSDASHNQQGWVLTYTGLWSWDFTIYLAQSTINAYNNGSHAGYASYNIPSLDLSKW